MRRARSNCFNLRSTGRGIGLRRLPRARQQSSRNRHDQSIGRINAVSASGPGSNASDEVPTSLAASRNSCPVSFRNSKKPRPATNLLRSIPVVRSADSLPAGRQHPGLTVGNFRRTDPVAPTRRANGPEAPACSFLFRWLRIFSITVRFSLQAIIRNVSPKGRAGLGIDADAPFRTSASRPDAACRPCPLTARSGSARDTHDR